MKSGQMIRVEGASHHNLKDVDLSIPLGRLVVFCGRSGSGKSSMAMHTIAAESQRRFLGALVDGATGLTQPKVERITGLPPVVSLSQRQDTPIVGTTAQFLGVHRVFRSLFAEESVFYCPDCHQVVRAHSLEQMVRRVLALPVGARLTIEAPLTLTGSGSGWRQMVLALGFSRVRVGETIRRIEEVGHLEPGTPIRLVVDRLKLNPERPDRVYDALRTAITAGKGRVIVAGGGDDLRFSDRLLCGSCDRDLGQPDARLFNPRSGVGACEGCLGRGSRDEALCARCSGEGLGEVGRHARVLDRSLGQWLALSSDALLRTLEGTPFDGVWERVKASICPILTTLSRLGLGALRLDEPVSQLGSGQRQRLRLVRVMNAELSGLLYVLDEPTARLGEAEVEGVIGLLRERIDRGHSLIVVSHHPAVLAAADHLVEFGPGAGPDGGRIVYQGDYVGLLRAKSPTAEALSRRGAPRCRVEGPLVDTGLCCLTGASGSGKSRHLRRALESAERRFERVRFVNGRGVRRNARSNAATYLGVWDVLRPLFAATAEAKVRGFVASDFSLNVKGGRCETCRGRGHVRASLDVLPELVQPCPSCEGRRFSEDLLQVKWRGRSATELLSMSAMEARTVLCGHPELELRLKAMVDAGLAYLPLGQSADQLSGGEAQRLALARELCVADKNGVLFGIDGPEIGLHPLDQEALVVLFHQLVGQGATVWMVSNHPLFEAAADQIFECHHDANDLRSVNTV